MKYTVVGTCDFRDCDDTRSYPWVHIVDAESPKEAAQMARVAEIGEDDPKVYEVTATYVFEGARTPYVGIDGYDCGKCIQNWVPKDMTEEDMTEEA